MKKWILLAVLIALAVFLVMFVSVKPGFKEAYSFSIDTTTSGGLQCGSPVVLRGVDIGRIKGVSLAQERVKLEVAIGEGYRIPIDSKFRIVRATLLGEVQLEILPSGGQSFISDGATISQDMAEPVEITELVESISKSGSKEKQLDEVNEKLDAIIDLLKEKNGKTH